MRRRTRIQRGIIYLMIAVLVSSCIVTYRDFPTAQLDRPAPGKTYDVLYYKIKAFPTLDAGGQSALHRAFRAQTPFERTEKRDEPPDRGLFVQVVVKWKPITLPFIIFGYLSLQTLTILPAWSTHEGYYVDYVVYVDGVEKRTFEYEITRKGVVWIVLLPFIWINLFTHSEEDAFIATAYQFFEDAAPIFSEVSGGGVNP